MRDKGYKRDLRRALEKEGVEIVSMTIVHGHIITVYRHVGVERSLNTSGSPKDQYRSIQSTVQTMKKQLKGIY